MAKLMTEIDTTQMGNRVLCAARADNTLEIHGGLTSLFEHGQWWINCNDCGAQWGAHDAEPGPFCFEQVSDGDESCLAAEAE